MTGTCLIMGITSELGQHCALAWLDKGWTVIGTHRAGADLSGVPEGVRALTLDFTNADDVGSCLDALPVCPDLTIVCAATYPSPEKARLSLPELKDVFAVNALTPYLFVRELLQRADPDRHSAFVFLATSAMFNANKASGVYAASKAAVRVLCAALADECRGTNTSVSCLVLGHIANQRKLNELSALAKRHKADLSDMRKRFLRKAEPNAVIDDFIGFNLCVDAIAHLANIGPLGNGTLMRLDGGASGTLV